MDSDVPLVTNMKDACLLAEALERAHERPGSKTPYSMQEFYELSANPFAERAALKF